MSRIFFSHSSNDNFAAIALSNWIQGEGWDDVFLDLHPQKGIVGGERWERRLHEATSRCEAVVFLISKYWLRSEWCKKEYFLARGLNKKLFALIIDPELSLQNLPEDLTGTWQTIDLAGRQDLQIFRVPHPDSHEERHVAFSREGLRRFKIGLEKAGLDPRFFEWPPSTQLDRPPYRGLQPLDSEDAGVFFGRKASIISITDALRGLRVSPSPRILVILGASGAGKSSFLRAGILPRLRRDDSNFLPLKIIRPERGVLSGEASLLLALESACPRRARSELRKAIRTGATSIRPLLAEHVANASKEIGVESSELPTLVIAIDQAEDLFRPEGLEEGARLLELVRDITETDNPPVIIIFAIRSDAYDLLQSARPLIGINQKTMSLPPMPHNAYRSVIEGPAERVVEAGGKLTIEPRLTDRLLEDIEKGGGKDALPLLAFTLEQLYREYGRNKLLQLKDYEDLGGLKGTIDAAVERAFRRADDDPRIPSDRTAREALLRRGLIPWLAGVDPDTKSPRRSVARRSDIPPEAVPLIDLLITERLLSTDTLIELNASGAETRVGTIEPTHDALLRQWGLFEGWLIEDFALLTILEGVKRASRDWESNGRSDGWLSHQGQRLADAHALDSRPDISARLDPSDRSYMARCRTLDDIRLAEIEQRRKDKEDEQGRRLADARKLSFVTSFGFLIAIALTVVSAYAYRQASNNADAAVGALAALIQTTSEIVRPIAKLEAVDGLIKEIRSSIDRFSSFSEDPRIIQERARTMLLLAEIDYERANIARMHDEAGQAFQQLNKLAIGGGVEFRYLRARSQHLLGLWAYDANDKTGALLNYKAAISELEDLLDKNRFSNSADGWLVSLSVFNQDLGDILLFRFNDPRGALHAFDAAYDERLKASAKDQSASASEKEALAWLLNKRGDVAVRLGDDSNALKLFEAARNGIETLNDDLWTNNVWPNNLAITENNIGLIYRRKSNYVLALRYMNASKDLLERVIRRDRNDLVRRMALNMTKYIISEAQFRMAICNHNTDLLNLAQTNMLETISQYNEVIRQAPDKTQWRLGRAGAEANLHAINGFKADWDGDRAAAAEEFSKAASSFLGYFVPLINDYPRSDFAAIAVSLLDWEAVAVARLGNGSAAAVTLLQAQVFLEQYRRVFTPNDAEALDTMIRRDLQKIVTSDEVLVLK